MADEEISNSFNEVQLQKVKFGIDKSEGHEIFASDVQSLKHDNPIVVIDSGSSISVSDVQPSNTFPPSDVTDGGMMTFSSEVQPLKA